MKRIIFFSLILSLVFNIKIFPKSIEEIFDFKCISTDFNGSVSNGKVVLVYGTNGVILRTSDFNVWEQIQLDLSLNILKIVRISTNFYALTNKGVILSTNEGKNWQTLEGTENVVEIFAVDNNLLLITPEKIKKIDVLNNQSNEINLNFDSSYYKPTIYKNTLFSATLMKNKIVFYSKNWKLGIFDLNDNSFNEILLDSILPYKHNVLREKLFSNGTNLLYITTDSNFFEFDIEKKTIRLIFSKAVKNDSLIVYYAKDADLYFMYTQTFYVLNADSLTTSKNLDSLYFGVVDKSKRILIIKNEPKNERHISNLRINELNRIQIDNQIYWIASGNDKLILISSNEGKNWEVKSLLNEIGRIYHFGQNVARMITETGKFFSTTNSGITWVPQKNYLPNFINNPYKVAYFIDSLRGFLWTGRYSTKGYNFLYTIDGGQNVQAKNLLVYPPSNKFLIRKYQDNIFFLFTQEYKKYKLNYHFVMNNNMEISDKFVRSDTIWESLEKDYVQLIDSIFFDLFFVVNGKFFGLLAQKENDTLKGYKVFTSDNFFKTHSFNSFLPFPYNYLNKIYLRNDTLIFLTFTGVEPTATSKINFLKLDENPKEVKSFFIPNYFYIDYFNFCDKFYLLILDINDNFKIKFMEVVNINDLTQTDYINFLENYSIGPGDLILPLEEVRLWGVSDSSFTILLQPQDYYTVKPLLFWFAFKPCPNFSKVDLHEFGNEYLYLGYPYPNPTENSNLIHFHIFHENTLSPFELEFKIFDLYGNDITNQVILSINQLNDYTTKFIIETNQLTNGCYFIRVTSKSKTKFLKLIINK